MTTLRIASLETRNFCFEAIDRTAAQARSALERGLAVHGREYGLPDGWWHQFAEEISERRIEVGRCRRDGEAMNDGEDGQ